MIERGGVPSGVGPALTMSHVIDRVMAEMGASGGRVELLERDAAQVILSRTLPEYSKYFPYEHTEELGPRSAVPGRPGFYYIACPLTILGCSRIVPGSSRPALGSGMAGAAYSDGQDVFPSGVTSLSSYSDVMMYADAAALTSLPATAIFHPPRLLEIQPRGDYVCSLVVLNCIHPDTLHTIGWSMADRFVELATYDVMIATRAILRRFSSIQTVYGEIQLNLEDMDAARDQRRDLVELLRTKAPFRGTRKKWYIY